MLLAGGGLAALPGHCPSDNLEVVQAENGILRRKLQGKTEGLLILSKEVEGLKEELEQVQALNRHLARQADGGEEELATVPRTPATFSTSSARERNRIALHRQLRSRNLALVEEKEGLVRQLEEARGDVVLWREKARMVGRKEVKVKVGEGVEAREEKVREMEEAQVRQARLKQDLQRLLDEREDMVREREELGRKVHRLTHQLRQVLELDTTGLLDIDHIIMENRCLEERLQRVQEEKELANQMGRRYKEALEGARSVRCTEGSREQVRGLLRQLSFPVPQPVVLDTAEGLETLLTWLLETLGDRQLQARHQRLAARELAARLAAAEERLARVQGGPVLANPSRLIMGGYKPRLAEEEEVKDAELEEKVMRRAEERQDVARQRKEMQEEEERKEEEKRERQERQRQEEQRKEEEVRRKIQQEIKEQEERRARQQMELKKQVEKQQEGSQPKLPRRKPDLGGVRRGHGAVGQSPGSLQAPGNSLVPRTPTPDYADLNARFENLLGLIGGSREEGEVERGEVVRYSCSQPPDLIPRGVEGELEEVSITLEGLQVGAREQVEEVEELPEHIQRMVQSALREMDL